MVGTFNSMKKFENSDVYLPLSLPACIKKPFTNMTVLMESYFIIVLLLKINWFNNMN